MQYSFFVPLFSAISIAAAASIGHPCTITSYTQSGSLASCSSVTIAAQTVPGGRSLTLLDLADGVVVTLGGDLTFGTGTYWTGDLLTISGGRITFDGQGHTINGNGAYYWDGKGSNGGKLKPNHAIVLRHSGTFKHVTVINVPTHAFAVENPGALTITGVTYDNSAGDKLGSDGKPLGHNTDGFDVAGSTGLTITGNTIINQDDCLALNSGTNIVFSNNICKNGHGISIGSIASGKIVDTVTITGNTVTNSENGLRIKTDAGATGASVKNVTYRGNKITGCTKFGVIIVQDYTNGKETGTAAPGVAIQNVSFLGTNTVGVKPDAVAVKVMCGQGDCTGTWNWSGLATSGSSNANIDKGGAPITGYTA